MKEQVLLKYRDADNAVIVRTTATDLVFDIYDVIDDDMNLIESRVFPVYYTPYDIVNDDGQNASAKLARIEETLNEIITRKLPNPLHLAMYDYYRRNPKDIFTKAVIKLCEKSNCFCPMIFTSLGCLSLCDYGFDGYQPLPMQQKKIVMTLLSSLRQRVRFEEYLKFLKKFELAFSNITTNMVGGYV
jgi:hypothetical protein